MRTLVCLVVVALAGCSTGRPWQSEVNGEAGARVAGRAGRPEPVAEAKVSFKLSR